MLAIIRETYGYGEKSRKVKRDRLGAIMGVKARRAREMLQQAKELNMVVVEGWSISVQEDHSLWPKPAEPPAGFEKRHRPPAALAETGTGALPLENLQEPLPGKAAEAPAAQRHRQETGTSKASPQGPSDPSGAPDAPRGGQHAQLVDQAWQLLGLPGKPPSGKNGAYGFAGAKKKAAGLRLMGEWVVYLEKHGPQEPFDETADPLGWYKDAQNYAMACRPGQGWRGQMEREGKIEAETPEDPKLAGWIAACAKYPRGEKIWADLRVAQPVSANYLAEDYGLSSNPTQTQYEEFLRALEEESTETRSTSTA
jgi:hypothetical protein